jgi:pimeloyl-ACP methyl ester carboxylesterase
LQDSKSTSANSVFTARFARPNASHFANTQDVIRNRRGICFIWAFIKTEVIWRDNYIKCFLSTGESLLKGRAEEIVCPVLLTGSLSDDMLPYIENGMCDVARKIKSSKVVFYPMGGHPLMWSNSDKF